MWLLSSQGKGSICSQVRWLCSSHRYLLAQDSTGSDGNMTPGWMLIFLPNLWEYYDTLQFTWLFVFSVTNSIHLCSGSYEFEDTISFTRPHSVTESLAITQLCTIVQCYLWHSKRMRKTRITALHLSPLSPPPPRLLSVIPLFLQSHNI